MKLIYFFCLICLYYGNVVLTNAINNIHINLPDLPYGYDTLEPYIDTDTMHFHHDKHHLAYATKTEAAINSLLNSNYDISFIPKKYIDNQSDEYSNILVKFLLENFDKIPKEFQPSIRNNGGGFVNHIEFWDSMTPIVSSRAVPKNLSKAITRDFGSMDVLNDSILKAGLSVFGSGWCWLVSDSSGKLSLKTTPNQDRPDIGVGSESGITVLIALDVWEHGYYLRYKNNREEYIKNLLQVINYSHAGKIYDKLTSSSNEATKSIS